MNAESKTTRNPLHEPAAGDIVDRGEAGRRSVEHVFEANGRRQVTYRRGSRSLLRTCYLESWRRWARGGTVVDGEAA